MIAILLVGCGPKYQPSARLVANVEQGELWVVVPFLNETGVSDMDNVRLSEMFTHELQLVEGVDVLPIGRSILVMRELGIEQVLTTGDAQTVMNALGADGVVLGTFTAYEPYPPMTIGAAIELHRRDAFRARAVDPDQLVRSPTGDDVALSSTYGNPVAQAAGIFYADDHEVRLALAHYAAGRSDPDSAYGAEIYLVNTELYTKFVSHRLIETLLANERARIEAMAGSQ